MNDTKTNDTPPPAASTSSYLTEMDAIKRRQSDKARKEFLIKTIRKRRKKRTP